jgi:hypothetical protein
VATCVSLLTLVYTTGAAITKDARQNVTAAYHLAHTGVIGSDRKETTTPHPQMRREPLPILVTATLLLLHPDFDKPYTIAELADGPLAESVKSVNALWRFLAAIFVFLLCHDLFSDRRVAAIMAVICLIISEATFLAQPRIVDRVYTELPEVAFMLLASWCAVRFVGSETKLRAMWLGVALGALALTKAAFLYIGLCFIVLLLVTDGIGRLQTPAKGRAWGSILSTYAVLALAMFATVAPWIMRNAIVFGNPQIASGTDASVLGMRMLLTEQPLLGIVYVYSPPTVRAHIVGPLTGYTEDDLKRGGRLAQIVSANEDKWNIFAQRIAAEGYQGDRSTWLRHAAFKAAIENPLRYAASIVIFAYKGMWFIATRAGATFNLVALPCFFGVFFGGLIAGRRVLVAAFGLPAGLFFFIAIFTHALPRYNAAMTPFVVLACLWLLDALVRRSYERSALFRNFVDRGARVFWPARSANKPSQSRPMVSTSSAETASRP